jgi:parallel beta-helix repeat protein
VEDNDKALDTSLFVQGTCPTGKICCPNAFPMDQDDCGEGLHLRGVMQSTVESNLVTGNAGGILLTDETGPTAYNLITHNASQNNTPDCGITLPSHALCGPGSNDSAGCVGGPQIGKPANGVFSNIVNHNLSQGNGAAGIGIFTPTPGTQAHSNVVADNLVEDNAQGGVVLHSHAAGQDLNDNNISFNLIVGNGADPGVTTVPAGVILFADGSATTPTGAPAPAAPLTGINVVHNAISDEGIDVFVGTKVATSLIATLNDLSGAGNAIGVDNEGTGTVAAQANWWGCTAGPGADPACATIKGTVLTTPILTSPVNVPNLSSSTAGGFQ